MRTDFIFENARFIGLFANRPAYCDSILTRLLSAFVGKFYSGCYLIGFARFLCGCRQLSATPFLARAGGQRRRGATAIKRKCPVGK
jgi:hypothetical protein